MNILNYFCKHRKENKVQNEEGTMIKNVITAVGNTNDLLDISENGEMKMTRLFYLLPDNLEENSETFTLEITSTNHYKYFPLFDQLLDKKIRITVDVIEDDGK